MVAIAASSSLFASLDKDGDGKVSVSELRTGMTAAVNLSEEEAAAIFAAADADGDGLLDREEFLNLAREAAEGAAAEEDNVSCLREAFAMYAAPAEGAGGQRITPESLRQMLGRLGLGSNGVEDCRAMICRFDLDGDGVLSFEEFRVMMHGGVIV